MPITIYGIKNCDTMKKARAWLDKNGVAYDFHDYRPAASSASGRAHGPRKSAGKVLHRAGTRPQTARQGQRSITEQKAIGADAAAAVDDQRRCSISAVALARSASSRHYVRGESVLRPAYAGIASAGHGSLPQHRVPWCCRVQRVRDNPCVLGCRHCTIIGRQSAAHRSMASSDIAWSDGDRASEDVTAGAAVHLRRIIADVLARHMMAASAWATLCELRQSFRLVCVHDQAQHAEHAQYRRSSDREACTGISGDKVGAWHYAFWRPSCGAARGLSGLRCEPAIGALPEAGANDVGGRVDMRSQSDAFEP